MKTMYTSPELEIVKFTVAENLMADGLEGSGGEVVETNPGAEPFDAGNKWNG